MPKDPTTLACETYYQMVRYCIVGYNFQQRPGIALPGLITSVQPDIPMDIFLQDPNDIPLPPEEVRIRELRAEVLPDQRRVRIYLELTPFQKRPNGEIKVTDMEGREVATISIIEAIDSKMQLTIHLQQGESAGEHTLSTEIFYYSDELFQDAAGTHADEPALSLPTEKQIVDSQQTTFIIENRSDAG